jgi:hypothetical protein
MWSSTKVIMNLIIFCTKTKINKLNSHLLRDQDILKFDVSMDKVFRMKIS